MIVATGHSLDRVHPVSARMTKEEVIYLHVVLDLYKSYVPPNLQPDGMSDFLKDMGWVEDFVENVTDENGDII